MPPRRANGPIHGLRVLVVEDDIVQSDELCLCMTDAGAIVVGPCGKAGEAIALIDAEGIDIAIVDINLGDGASYEVAGHLLAAKLPFLFVTGYDCVALPEEFGHVECLDKPFSEVHLVRAIAGAFATTRPGRPATSTPVSRSREPR